MECVLFILINLDYSTFSEDAFLALRHLHRSHLKAVSMCTLHRKVWTEPWAIQKVSPQRTGLSYRSLHSKLFHKLGPELQGSSSMMACHYCGIPLQWTHQCPITPNAQSVHKSFSRSTGFLCKWTSSASGCSVFLFSPKPCQFFPASPEPSKHICLLTYRTQCYMLWQRTAPGWECSCHLVVTAWGFRTQTEWVIWLIRKSPLR